MPSGYAGLEAVFIVTPRLAQLFDSGSPFLRSAMKKIYGKRLSQSGRIVQVSALVAVVDKIPGNWLIGEQRFEPCEGVSLLIKTPVSSSFTVSESGDKDQKSVLEFRSDFGKLYEDSPVIGRTCYRLPLANTLFINGRRTTMNYTTWKKVRLPQQKSRSVLEVDASQFLRTYRFSSFNPPEAMEESIVPLVPITKPRSVKTAMGNVIREIEVDNKTVPASSELEAAVMTSVKSSPPDQMVDPKTRIYASVQTNDHSQYTTPENFIQLMKSGAGLHQVIGGGGGWGNKKGLLALDPAGAMEEDGQAESEASAVDELEPKLPDMEQSLAKKGQTIQFYQLKHNLIKANAPRQLMEDETAVKREDKKNLYGLIRGAPWGLRSSTSMHEKVNHQQIVVGTIPTPETEDTMPDSSLQTSDPDYIELPDRFGALCEGAIELEVQKYPRMQGTIQRDGRNTVTSKRLVSVPYSYLMFRVDDRGKKAKRREKLAVASNEPPTP
jgi:hypothetical protein